ncbi:hypothetical protein ACFL2M_00260 [Patescibacteria group bacterium]
MGKSSRIRRRNAESRRKGPQSKPIELRGDKTKPVEATAEGEEIFVPDNEQLNAAIQEWDDANTEIERYVNHAGLLDMDDPVQKVAGEALADAEDKIRARLNELGYQSVRIMINLFFYENNTDPDTYPDGYYRR